MPAHSSEDSGLPTLPSPAHAPTMTPDLVAAMTPTLDEGDRDLPRYGQGDLLGRGGMGEVVSCRDRRIGRDVAMKVVRERGAARPNLVARFLREARVQGQLEHPAVVPVYDLGVGPDGDTYFTMKRVRGLTLGYVLARRRAGDDDVVRRFSRRRLLAAFGSVCLAIDFAHQRGVLHRDLKPDNVMLGDFGEVYVLDWGLAKVAGVEPVPAAPRSPAPSPGQRESVELPVDDGAHTVAGAVMGTPGYMAPEQLRGAAEELDARSDVYALGALLFEILAGVPLHARDRLESLIESTLQGADARPSARVPDAGVPPELEAICVRATALTPADRFTSARELHDAIECFLDGDRDLEQRRAAVEGYAAAAATAAERARQPDGGAEARREALREAGRALALDPQHAGALRTMLALMLEPPAQVPAEVEAELELANLDTLRAAARGGGLAWLGMLSTLPLLLFMGVRNVPLLALWIGVVVISICSSFATARRRRPTLLAMLPALLASMLAVGMSSTVAGPLVLVPGLAVVTTMGFLLHARGRWRTLVIACGALTVVVPLLLELTGVIAPSYEFVDGTMVVVPRALSLPPGATMLLLSVGSIAMVIVAGVFITSVRNALARTERRLQMQAWHLRQLVPAEAHAGPPEPAAAAPRHCDWLG